jgi:glycosyltransferase involved in cell wall biosynthesis
LATRVGLDGRALGNINRNRGIGRYTASLVERLARCPDGFELVLFSYGERSVAGLLAPEVLDSLEWHTLPGAGGGAFYGGPIEQVGFARAVNGSGVELFHGIDHNMTPLLSCPSIATVHDLIPLVLRGTYLGPKSFMWMQSHRAACRRASAVVAVSDATRDDLERIWKIPRRKIEVVPEGVSPVYRPVEDRQAIDEVLARYGIAQPYFLYLGGFDPRKNIGNMLLGFKRFLRSGEGTAAGTTMVLCGDTGGFERYLAEAIEELGLRGRVLLAGFADDDDLPALYSGALALVFVSTYEGFGLPLLEAMACGTPVLASDVSSIPGVVGDAALLVDPLDPSAIAAGLCSLALDTDTISGLVSAGLERSSSFTWERAAARVVELYKRVLGGASG